MVSAFADIKTVKKLSKNSKKFPFQLKADYNNAVKEEEEVYQQWKKQFDNHNRLFKAIAEMNTQFGQNKVGERKLIKKREGALSELEGVKASLQILTKRLQAASEKVTLAASNLPSKVRPKGSEHRESLWKKAVNLIKHFKIPNTQGSSNAAALGIANANGGQQVFSFLSFHRHPASSSFRTLPSQDDEDVSIHRQQSSSFRKLPSQDEESEVSPVTNSTTTTTTKSTKFTYGRDEDLIKMRHWVDKARLPQTVADLLVQKGVRCMDDLQEMFDNNEAYGEICASLSTLDRAKFRSACTETFGQN